MAALLSTLLVLSSDSPRTNFYKEMIITFDTFKFLVLSMSNCFFQKISLNTIDVCAYFTVFAHNKPQPIEWGECTDTVLQLSVIQITY
ncbi:hypothetical protein BIT28_02760 [Photobacterium proteolyticum]|uniref:Uncharacterized protein n=1 Tax=Photobacterium proteolyticum TaxID=1903952 RepID=A0A1Q9G9U5_9GAMM|nr:hypothetical protein BIT28_02760 [Photobacterium proteolyticum]